MTRPDILDKAKECVCGQRVTDYGTPENNFDTIGLMWSIYLRAANPGAEFAHIIITPHDVAMMMALLKIARIATGTGTADSYIDLAGYAACGGEINTKHE